MQNSVVREFEDNPNVVTLLYNEAGRNGETRDWTEELFADFFLRSSIIFDETGSNSRTYYNQASTGIPFGRVYVIDQEGKVALPYFGHDARLAIEKIYELLGTGAEVVGRHVFYNNSAFDGNHDGANEQDDWAVATDKAALLPGEKAGAVNYTGYSRGVNGIMIDIARLPGTPTADDFVFKVGNDDSLEEWTPGPVPTSITVRPTPGVVGSDRITLIWRDGDVRNQWLQVTVRPTDNTGLTEADVFHFGNAVGESGNSATDAKVNATDVLLARNNPRALLDPTPIDFPYDYNRDRRVNATDMLIARDNQTHLLDALKLITAPPEPANQEAPLHELGWIYEVGQMRTPRRPDKEDDPAEEAVEQVLMLVSKLH